MEEFKDIKGYEGKYQISTLGNVVSLNYNNTNKSKNLSQRINRQGRPYVNLCANGKYKSWLVHRLVAENFLKKESKNLEVNHINGIKTDNRLSNLEWVTKEKNTEHAIKNNLIKANEEHPRAKLSDREVKKLKKEYLIVKNYAELGRKYGITKTHTRDLILGNRRNRK